MHRCVLAAALCGVAGSAAVSMAQIIVPVTLNPFTTDLYEGAPAVFGDGTPTWADEFEGTQLDKQWTAYYPGPRRGGFDTLDMVKVAQDAQGRGTLRIGTSPKIANGHYQDINGNTKFVGSQHNGLYPTAMIGTQDTKFFRYGLFETSVKLQEKDGNWSAFWLQSPWIFESNKEKADPVSKGSEIDIFEFTRKNAGDPGKASHALHYNGYGNEGQEHRFAINDKNHTKTTPIAIDHIDRTPGAFNKISALWTPDYYAFYVNDKLSWVAKDGTKPAGSFQFLDVAKGADGKPLPGTGTEFVDFDSNFQHTVPEGISAVAEFMILSMEVPDDETSAFAGHPADSKFPDQVEFDYVRYYGGEFGTDLSYAELKAQMGNIPRHPLGAIPEPTSATLAMAIGAAGLLRRRRTAR